MLANVAWRSNDLDQANRLRKSALETPVHHTAELFYINRDRRWYEAESLGFPEYSFEDNCKDHRQMLRYDPGYYNALFFMSIVLGREDRHDEALVGWYGCLALHPDDFVALTNRALTHYDLGHFDEALADAERAISLAPKTDTANVVAAWVLATCPEDKLRNGPRSLELATKAYELNPRSVNVLEALAAAHAETGDFPAAVKWAEQALELEHNDKNRDLIKKELDNYRNGKPWRIEVKKN
jgi:tetratricopeptide (TPR) repeat protein